MFSTEVQPGKFLGNGLGKELTLREGKGKLSKEQ